MCIDPHQHCMKKHIYLWVLLLMHQYAYVFDEDYQARISFFPSPYIGGKLGYSHFQHACEPHQLTCDNDDWGFGIYTGYAFHTLLTLEIGLSDLGQAIATYPSGNSKKTYTGNMRGVDFSLYSCIYSQGSASLLTKLGGFYWQGTDKGPLNTLKANGVSPLVGFGLEYAMTRGLHFRWEYQFIYRLDSESIGGSNNHLATIGLRYRFGSNEEKTKRVSTNPSINITSHDHKTHQGLSDE